MSHEQDGRHANTIEPCPGEEATMGLVIVDCAVYREGKRISAVNGTEMSAAVAAANGTDDFVWIGLHDPSPDEMQQVTSGFALHPLAIEDALRAHQRPKLELYEDMLFLVLKTLVYVDPSDDVETGQIAAFVGANYIVTVRLGAGAELGVTRRELEQHADVLGHGPFAVLYSVCDRVVDAYEAVAEELENDVQLIEQAVFSDDRHELGGRGDDAHRIYRLKRELAEFRRAVAPLRDPLLRFTNGQVEGMPKQAMAFFRDVSDHAIRVTEQVETMDVLLSSAHDALLASISVQQNDDMRKISAWVAIVAVPTMVAGIYGMNFDHMPELHWRYGYPLALALMAGACLVLYRMFKRSGWL
jgi:magnesium transporter